jgi:hypothetical protein
MFTTGNRRLPLTAALIVLVMYNVVIFVISFDRGAGFWTGYAFSILAILLMTAVYARFFGQELRSKVYGWPLLTVAWRYLIIQIIAGLAQMALSPVVPFQYGLAVNVVLLGACLLGLVVMEAAKEYVEHLDAKIEAKTYFIRTLREYTENLTSRAKDEGLKKSLKTLAEAVRYSDPMTNPQLSTIEDKIEVKVNELAEKVKKTDVGGAQTLCEEMQLLLADRNRKCKMLK